jgi:hypothetical protein
MVWRLTDAAHTTMATMAPITASENASRRLAKVNAAANANVTPAAKSALANCPSY